MAYGKPDATDEELSKQLKANIHDFIMSLEDGYETHVGQRGVKLSSGQVKNFAGMKNPPILILDEATSALDNESGFIQESLEELVTGPLGNCP